MSYAEGYVDVATRIAEFIAKYPDGSLQMDQPKFETLDGQTYLIGRAYAFRTPDDPCPGIGHAWEPFPGRTPYTKGSELMVLETSAWGRALAALGIATKAGIASADEVRAAQERFPDRRTSRDGAWRDEPVNDKGLAMLHAAMKKRHLTEVTLNDLAVHRLGWELPRQGLKHLTGGRAKDLLDLVDSIPVPEDPHE